ncbi:MAG: ImmA/IrrE family metallo-endopeptidase [Acidimicrobiales bacterium]
MSILQQLRELIPRRPLHDDEARFIVERQAGLLRRLSGLPDDPLLPRSVIEDLPKVNVVADPHLPSSGASHWTGSLWQITINAGEPFTRQRFTLAHEFQHIILHPFVDEMFAGSSRTTAEARAEQLCDYFAACLLMPKLLVRQAWVSGGDNQNPDILARLFGVSTPAMQLRLRQLGLLTSAQRCRSQPRSYYRRSARQSLDEDRRATTMVAVGPGGD